MSMSQANRQLLGIEFYSDGRTTSEVPLAGNHDIEYTLIASIITAMSDKLGLMVKTAMRLEKWG